MRMRKVERIDDWRETGQTDAGVKSRIWALYTGPLVVSRALFQENLMVLPKGEIRRSET